MKAFISKVTFLEEKPARFGGGMEYSYRIEYDDKSAYYSSKKADQTYFVEGVETEFTEEERESKKGNKYYIVKPIYESRGGNSNFSKQLKREQSKYSGFAVSYVKDLFVGGILIVESKQELIDTWKDISKEMIDFMVEQDKRIES